MKLTNINHQRLRELKLSLRFPMNRIVNDILEKHFTGQLKEVSVMKVTEVEVMVSKKVSVNFNSYGKRNGNGNGNGHAQQEQQPGTGNPYEGEGVNGEEVGHA
jgi:hypothetical protein